MAMSKTGDAISTAPSQIVQGYLDSISGKQPSSQDAVYMSGFDLASLVKEGKADPPSWAVGDGQMD